MGLRNRPIPVQVGILVAIPLLFLLGLYGVAATSSIRSAVAQTRANRITNELALPLSAFQAQVAREAGLALLSLAEPPSPQVAEGLSAQEAATSKSLTKLMGAYHSSWMQANATGSETAAMRVLVTQAATLDAIRRSVAQKSVSLTTALAGYDAINSAGNDVIVAIVSSQTSTAVVTESLQSTSLYKADLLSGAEAALLAADLAQLRFPDTDRAMLTSLAAQRQQDITDALPPSSALSQLYARTMSAKVADAMTSAESTVATTPWQVGVPPQSVVAAEGAFVGYAETMGKEVQVAESALPQTINQQRHNQLVQIVVAAAIGLLAVAASVLVSVLIGRSLVRQLRRLRESALTLAHDSLPGIIGKLRVGDSVDVAQYTPANVAQGNEISQVWHAFNVVQLAAVQSAVDEARLRRGVSEVFRNLAGRSQSLLHRQLALLDSMERRATEPDQLEDLFRIDHLTTRMRRHAEGLIILSGDTPARGWRQPVPLVDVLRGAVAEVEDYTRIQVLCRSAASVVGHAVADIIHLVAELAENATVFSPPNTPVRMQGDVVGRGFAIEIEDRGLGISQARLDEINAMLANPPQFDPSGSDRLGLFIVGQLAQRHEIKVSLRPSIFGGTTAVVLIPTVLVVEENAADGSPEGTASQDGHTRFREFGGRHAALAVFGAGDGAAASAGNGRGVPAGDADGAGNGGPATAGDPGDLSPAPYGPTVPPPPPAEPVAQPSWSAIEVMDDDPSDRALTAAEIAEFGLPVRVRQANLAPQLRDTPPDTGPVDRGFGQLRRSPWFTSPRPAAADPGPAAAPASPEDARTMVNALQRGWRLGRAVSGDTAQEQQDDSTNHGSEG